MIPSVPTPSRAMWFQKNMLVSFAYIAVNIIGLQLNQINVKKYCFDHLPTSSWLSISTTAVSLGYW